eukprot:TRINITY_DN16252_c0_g1_i4.p1 TRINITY_DN16252_c0_g1~~TRINITY_DN16252_c0_g1_i4.p1  ORF type:complete len:172 (-),score=36.74 TRINITY_DN16252_c0_g1_i4:343-858(-)
MSNQKELELELEARNKQLRRLTTLLEDKDRQLDAASKYAGPEVTAELATIRGALDLKNKELTDQAFKFEREMRAMHRLLDDKSTQLQTALHNSSEPDSEIETLRDLVRMRDEQLEDAGVKSASLLKDKNHSMQALVSVKKQVESLETQLSMSKEQNQKLLLQLTQLGGSID